MLDPQADILTSRGEEIPFVSGLALIDSGASATCIDDAAAVGARLPAVDTARMAFVPTPTPAAPQEMDHAAHMMGDMAGGWRMPPMDPNMPMIPGLEMALPPV